MCDSQLTCQAGQEWTSCVIPGVVYTNFPEGTILEVTHSRGPGKFNVRVVSVPKPIDGVTFVIHVPAGVKVEVKESA